MNRSARAAYLTWAAVALTAAPAAASSSVSQTVTVTFQEVALLATAQGAASIDFYVPENGQGMIADPISMGLQWTSVVTAGKHRAITAQLDAAPPAWLQFSLAETSSGGSQAAFSTISALSDTAQTLVSAIPSEAVSAATFQCTPTLAPGYTMPPAGDYSLAVTFTITDED